LSSKDRSEVSRPGSEVVTGSSQGEPTIGGLQFVGMVFKPASDTERTCGRDGMVRMEERAKKVLGEASGNGRASKAKSEWESLMEGTPHYD
jgi:hypothetical protein